MTKTSKPSPFSLSGHRALVTGSTQGVGEAMAIAMAAAGADVCIHGHERTTHGDDVVRRCQDLGVDASLVIADLLDVDDRAIQRFAGDVNAAMPGIDLLVNNAGIYIDVRFEDMSVSRFRDTFRLNVEAGFFLTQTFAKQWIDEGVRGRVLFTGSINAFLAEPVHVAYDASKGAVAAMVRSLCVSLAPHGIRVNSIAPGLIRTPLTNAVLSHQADVLRWMELHTPNQTVPEPNVCGGAAVFLLSDAAEHIHGQTLLIDGGMSVWQQPDLPGG